MFMPVNGAQDVIAKEVSSWDGVIELPHRFGGVEFKLGRREIGHIHGSYQADIAFPMEKRNQLVAEGKAEPHHILPQSGWITFRFRKQEDVKKAIDLFRISYDIALEKQREVSQKMTSK